MKTNTLNIVETLREQYPESNGIYPRKYIEQVCSSLGYQPRDYYPLLKSPKVRRGVYNLTALLPQTATEQTTKVSSNVQSITSNSETSFVEVDQNFIPWGHF